MPTTVFYRPPSLYVDVAHLHNYCTNGFIENILRIVTKDCPKAKAIRETIDSLKTEEKARGHQIVRVDCERDLFAAF